LWIFGPLKLANPRVPPSSTLNVLAVRRASRLWRTWCAFRLLWPLSCALDVKQASTFGMLSRNDVVSELSECWRRRQNGRFERLALAGLFVGAAIAATVPALRFHG
jgi:hypothetical protein